MVSQTNRQGSKSFSGSREEKNYNTNVITPASIAPATPVNLPATPTPGYVPPVTAVSSPGLEALGTSVKDGQYVYDPTKTESYNAVAQSNQTNQTSLQAYIDNIKGIQPQNQEADYLKREKQAGIQNLQQSVNDYTSQLNTIVKHSDAEALGLEGQGRGITESIIGGQQAQIRREAAIQALPIQAQLDAAQGNLTAATARLDKLWSIHKEDVTNEYNYKKSVFDAVFSFASKSEQNLLDARLSDIKSADAKTQSNLDLAQQWSKMAVQTGQSNLITQFTALDPKSATFARDFGVLQAKVVDPTVALDVQLKRAQLAGLNAPKGPAKRDTQVVDGKLIDMQTGEVITDVGAKNQQVTAQSLQSISDVDSLLKNKTGMATAVGTNFLTRSNGGGFWSTLAKAATLVGFGPATKQVYSILTGKEQAFIGGVEQMRQQLTLDNLVRAKQNGATFGALSDGERQMLASSATKIGTWAIKDEAGNVTGYNIDENTFKKEVQAINNFAKIDYLNRGGEPAEIGAVVNSDKTVWVKNADGTFTQLK